MSRWVSFIGLLLLSLLLVSCSSAESTQSAEIIEPTTYVEDLQNTPHLLVDVRTPEEYADGFIEGSVNIPLQELESRLSEIPNDMPVVVYCRSGNRSAQAADILISKGYSDVYDLGGILQWEQYGYRITQESS